MNSGKFLLGIITGIAVGTVVGILIAPDKGSNTRKKILKKAEDRTDDFRYKYYELKDSIKEQAMEKLQAVKDIAQNGFNKSQDSKMDVPSKPQNSI